MNKDFDRDSVNNQTDDNPDYAFKNVMKSRENSRAFSIVSLVLAALSVAFSMFIPIGGIVTGVGAIVFGALSRRNIGYFDRPSLIGIFGAIFSIVFSLTVLLIKALLTG